MRRWLKKLATDESGLITQVELGLLAALMAAAALSVGPHRIH